MSVQRVGEDGERAVLLDTGLLDVAEADTQAGVLRQGVVDAASDAVPGVDRICVHAAGVADVGERRDLGGQRVGAFDRRELVLGLDVAGADVDAVQFAVSDARGDRQLVRDRQRVGVADFVAGDVVDRLVVAGLAHALQPTVEVAVLGTLRQADSAVVRVAGPVLDLVQIVFGADGGLCGSGSASGQESESDERLFHDGLSVDDM
jgi:hypothetical protein